MSLVRAVRGCRSYSTASRQILAKLEELKECRTELLVTNESYIELQQKAKELYARKMQFYQDQSRDVETLQSINEEETVLLYEEQELHPKVCTSV